MEQPTCKTCRFWEAANAETESSGEPDYEQIQIIAKPCKCPSMIDASVSEAYWRHVPADGLGYSDREGYGAQLRTGPDFGCVHWESKEGA